MSTEPLGGRRADLPATEPVLRPRHLDARPEPVTRPAEALDMIGALQQLGLSQDSGEPAGLEDALLAWVMPRPRNPDTLSQSRIVLLLGGAADLLSRSGNLAPDIARLGSAAMAQELRTQRSLAERRATIGLSEQPQ